jgi:1,2-diacylglycerol 3-beta-galactosyltransferase
VSFISHFNRIIFESLQRADPSVPLVTVMTDLADYPPHFWLERQEQFFVCGTARAVEQARDLGLREDQVFRTSGMILHPRFYERVGVDRAKERQRLGLDPQLPTGLVMFGGQGSSEMRQIARSLDGSRLGFQLIFICGRNQKLAAALRGQPARHPRFIEEFTTEVPYYMYLSDFFIGKPGPGSISEALAMKLPVIVERNAWTMPHERFNADWVEEMQVGLVVRSFRRIELAVERLLEPQTLVRYRANAAALNNRAVFEIPGILESVLNRAPTGA